VYIHTSRQTGRTACLFGNAPQGLLHRSRIASCYLLELQLLLYTKSWHERSALAVAPTEGMGFYACPRYQNRPLRRDSFTALHTKSLLPGVASGMRPEVYKWHHWGLDFILSSATLPIYHIVSHPVEYRCLALSKFTRRANSAHISVSQSAPGSW
jgi:hypothetical protein